jgi:NADH-quinone oxidoreductase subunit E
LEIEMTKFTEETKSRLDELVSRYPTKRAALIPSLWVAQEVYGGWLPEEAMKEVADHLQLPPAEVEGVATFYTMFNKVPVGKHRIEICHNVMCMVQGAEHLIHHCERRLGISAGETTPDGEITLERVECLGACSNAPAAMIGPKYYENVTIPQMDTLIEALNGAPSEVATPAQSMLPEMRKF